MSKLLTGVLLCVALASPALALVVSGPGPEVDGGILGMVVAAGAVYLFKRRSRSRS